ncbi:MAG: hypothetical protein ABSH09_29870 [Bryobacteraceae bacterium]
MFLALATTGGISAVYQARPQCFKESLGGAAGRAVIVNELELLVQ